MDGSMNLFTNPSSKYSAFKLGTYVNEHWLEFAVGHVNPLWSPRRIKARLAAKRHETADMATFTFIPNRNWLGFVPGQFVPLRLTIGGIVHERYYSVTSAPQSDLVQLTVKRLPNGRISRYLHDELAIGTVVELGQAQGDFVLPAQVPSRMLMLAGGAGITPIYSLITDALRRQPDADIVLAYYARSDRDFALLNRLEAAARMHRGLRLVRRVDTRYHAEDMAEYAPDYAQREAWACGPAPMLAAIESTYLDEQLSRQLHTERFAAIAAAAHTTSGSSQSVTFVRSALQTRSSAATLLQAAEASGLRPAHGCRMGICNSCSCTKISGSVRHILTGEINDAPNTEIRICVNEPLTAVTLDL